MTCTWTTYRVSSRVRQPGVTEREETLARRAKISGLVRLGKSLGYGLYVVAIVLFVSGFIAGFTELITTLITVSLVVGSLILAPAIVFHYGVKAAERADAGQVREH